MNTETKLPDILLTPCDSTQLHAYGYCHDTQRLAIQFKRTVAGERVGGSIYHYANVTPEAFNAFSQSDSKGAHFGIHIKPFADKYPFTKAPEVERKETA